MNTEYAIKAFEKIRPGLKVAIGNVGDPKGSVWWYLWETGKLGEEPRETWRVEEGNGIWNFHFTPLGLIAPNQVPRPDVEFHVKKLDGKTEVFHSFDQAVGLAVAIAAGNGETQRIDVVIWSEHGARAWGGDDAVEQYKEDPEASVFERIEVGASSLGRIA